MEINVNLKSKSYKVIIEKGILSKVNNFINKDKKILICIISHRFYFMIKNFTILLKNDKIYQ